MAPFSPMPWLTSEFRSVTSGALVRPNFIPYLLSLQKKIKTFSISEPGYSDAIEFTDGKLICGKQQSVSEISWQSVLQQLSVNQLSDLIRHAGLIAFLNW